MFADLLSEFDTSATAVPNMVVAFRMVAAIILGGAIGWEREMNARAAGLRTHMMVSLAACLFAIVALEMIALETEDENRIKADPIKLISAITSGVAFLAAGSIIVSGGKVRGLTTGASMWLVGAVGMCCGTGKFVLAFQATVLALVVLWLINRFAARPPTDEDATDDTESG